MSVQAPTSTLMRNGWKQALASLRHGRGWSGTLVAFTATLLLLQCLLLFAFSVRGINRILLERAGLHLEVLPGARDQEIQELYAVLKDHPSVQHVDYVPKEKAYEQEKLADPELVSFLEQYKLNNPFPDSFLVTLRGADDYADLLVTVQQEKYRTVLDPSSLTSVSDQERDLQGVLQMTQAFQMFAFAFAILAGLILCAMMAEYVGRALRGRRDEFILQNALGAAHVSLVSLLASEITALLIMAFAIASLLTVAILALAPLVVSSFSTNDIFIQLQAAIRPFLLTAIPATFLIELILIPACAWGIASFRIRRSLSRPS